jgi:primosomal protein N' (replication factor Y)
MDRNKFYQTEIKYRKMSQLPPIGKMAAIILSGQQKSDVDQTCIQLLRHAPNIQDIEIYGPAPAPLSRLKGNFRQRFLIHDKKSRNIQKFINNWITKYPQNSKVNIAIDIDPYNFI